MLFIYLLVPAALYHAYIGVWCGILYRGAIK